MPRFQVCDLTLESNVAFPELSPANGTKVDCSFRLRRIESLPKTAYEWFHRWELADGTSWLLTAKTGKDYLLRFPEFADFRIVQSGRAIVCDALRGTPLATLRHLFLDQVVPLVLSQQGRLVLHASAVVSPDGAIAFLGMTGRGKSTLAADFCQQGFQLLADDCLLLRESKGRFLSVPGYPGLRLWGDTLSGLGWHEAGMAPVAHYTEKKRVGTRHGRVRWAAEEVPLLRIYVLEPTDPSTPEQTIRIIPMRPQDALMELVQCAYRLDITDRNRVQEQFESLSRIAAGAPLYRLQFPHDFARLSEVRGAILRNGNP
ncbi:MAG: hypothetical protein HY651_05460 [Acidobacteria bacterium]|nr:hypothetical protein [Acidobacteriota bacterium]